MKDEVGYFLLETVLLGMFMLLAAEGFWVWHTAQHLCERSQAEMAAIFLAQERLADLEVKARAVSAAEVSAVPLVQADYMRSGCHFQVDEQLNMVHEAARLREAHVSIRWQENGHERVLTFFRRVHCHA